MDQEAPELHCKAACACAAWMAATAFASCWRLTNTLAVYAVDQTKSAAGPRESMADGRLEMLQVLLQTLLQWLAVAVSAGFLQGCVVIVRAVHVCSHSA